MAEPTTIIHGDWSKDRRKRIGAARRLDDAYGVAPRHCERSEAIQTSSAPPEVWIASSLTLLAMTGPSSLPHTRAGAKRRVPGIQPLLL